MPDPYAPQEYWDALLDLRADERAVAYPHLALALNRAMYDAERDQVDRLLARNGDVARAPRRVLDVGSGTGVWIDYWKGRGGDTLTGIDLTQDAVDGLRQRYPGETFLRADIGAPDHGIEGPFDLISAMSVLLHITDDERWRRALATIAELLHADGHAVLIEPLVVHRWWGPAFGPQANSRARTLDEYDRALRAAGLDLVAFAPATVLLANVIDTRSRLSFAALRGYWTALALGIGPRERAGRIAAAVLGALDRPLRRRLPGGPSAKVMLLRRR